MSKFKAGNSIKEPKFKINEEVWSVRFDNKEKISSCDKIKIKQIIFDGCIFKYSANEKIESYYFYEEKVLFTKQEIIDMLYEK